MTEAIETAIRYAMTGIFVVGIIGLAVAVWALVHVVMVNLRPWDGRK